MGKILITTPVHRVKDYAFKEWLKSVKSQTYTSYDLLLVDNTSDLNYIPVIEEYLKELDIKATIYHQDKFHAEEPRVIPIEGTTREFKDYRHLVEKKVAYAREYGRQQFLKGEYDYFFLWESDIIVEPIGLEKMLEFIDKFAIVQHDYPNRQYPGEEMWGYGFVLFQKWCVERFDFLKAEDREIWHGIEHKFNKLTMQNGGAIVELHSYLKIQHLAEEAE